jgi:NTE family protein
MIQQHPQQQKPESVLILQGGGSLGAYECGVCKSLARNGITKFDTIAGISIGSINAAILAAGYSQEKGISDSVKTLESFWLESMIEDVTPSFLPYKERSELSAAYSLMYGNPNAFVPLWFMPSSAVIAPPALSFYYYLFNSPYLYSNTRLKKSLERYVDFAKLKKIRIQGSSGDTYQGNDDDGDVTHNNNNIPRLILPCVDVQKGEPVVFDSFDVDIDADNIMACTGYAIYGLPWTKKDGRYLWDGSLRHNTPLKAVADASTKREKILYVCDVFPKTQQKLPSNMFETLHRVRDMLFGDKSIEEIKARSDLTKKQLQFIEKMYNVMTSSMSKHEWNATNKSRSKELELEYNDIIQERGAIIHELIHIQRKEKPGRQFLFEDMDFSAATIKQLIKEGEQDAEETLKQTQKQLVKP